MDKGVEQAGVRHASCQRHQPGGGNHSASAITAPQAGGDEAGAREDTQGAQPKVVVIVVP